VTRLPVALEVLELMLLCEPSILERACEVDTAEPGLFDAATEPDDLLADPIVDFDPVEELPRFVAVAALPPVALRAPPEGVPRLAIVPLPELRALIPELVRFPGIEPLRAPGAPTPLLPYIPYDRPP
jgi:hypothetical protein